METTSSDPAPKFHVPVHSIIHSMQKQHGIIPHQDYTQYRRYCTRRLDRLRHVKSGGREMLHGSGGRGKHASNFIPRKYLNKKGFEEKTNSTKTDSTKTAVNTEEVVVAEESSEAATDYYDKVHHVNFLLILLVSAERCWSFAMELKAEYDEMKHANATKKQTPTLYKKKKHTSLGKLRKQFLRKLRKAAEYAASLENMAMNVLTTEVTVVECQAYASWMRGNAALERNRFEPAEREYSNALQGIQVLKQLAANGSNLEMQDYFSSRAEYTIEPLRAYCYYELQQQQSSKGDNSSYSAAVVPNTISNANLGMSQLLQSKLEQKMEETRRAETSKTDSKYGSIVYRGITVSVDSEDLRMALCKIDELQQLSSSSTIPVGETETNNTEGDENFVKLLNAYDEASNICSFQLKELGKLASGKYVNASKRMYNCVKGFMQHQKLVATMERNEQIANNLSLPRTQEAEDQKIKRMEDLAHMYSLLLQDARMLTSLPSATDDGTNSSEVLVEEDDFALEAHAHVLRFRSFKCFYAAHLYSSKELVSVLRFCS